MESIDRIQDCNQAVALASHINEMSDAALNKIPQLKIPVVGENEDKEPKTVLRKVRLDRIVEGSKLIETEEQLDGFLDDVKSELKKHLDDGEKIRLI